MFGPPDPPSAFSTMIVALSTIGRYRKLASPVKKPRQIAPEEGAVSRDLNDSDQPRRPEQSVGRPVGLLFGYPGGSLINPLPEPADDGVRPGPDAERSGLRNGVDHDADQQGRRIGAIAPAVVDPPDHGHVARLLQHLA